MRPSNVLALSAASGFLSGATLFGLSAGTEAMPAGSLVGLALGIGVGGLLLACTRYPLVVAAVLLGVEPLTLVLGRLFGLPALADLPPLLALPLAITLARRPTARRVLRPTLLTAATCAYAALSLPAILFAPPEQIVPRFCAGLAPLSFFLVGILLPAAAPLAQVSSGEARAAVLRRLGWVAVASAVGLAALVPLLDGTESEGGWANPLALLLVLALAWDTPRTLWLALLGGASRVRRTGMALAALGALLLVAGTLARRAPGGMLLALAVACLAVAARRRRLTELLLLAGVFAPLALFAAHAASSGPGDLARIPAAFGDTQAWAGSWAGSGPAASASDGMPAQTQYLATLAVSGIPGLAALVGLLGIAVVECRRGWRLLRPTSSEAGGVIAAGGMALYLLIAGLTSVPLNEPAVGLLFWLILGLADGTLGALARTQALADDTVDTVDTMGTVDTVEALAPAGLRGSPLRVAYLADGADSGETPAALADYAQALDRRRVTPLLIAYGAGPLAGALRGMRVVVREVSRHDAGRSCTDGWVATWSPRARRAAATRVGRRCLAGADALCHGWLALGEWARLARAALELRPDLLVSTSPRLHIPALVAGRIAGVPVQWHAREAASPRLQRALNVLALWTDGVLVPSQTLARMYGRRRLRRCVRVLRPSVALPSAVAPGRLAALRRELEIADASPALLVAGPVTNESGHEDLLDAVMLLLGRYPRLRLLIASEALPGQVVHAPVPVPVPAEPVAVVAARESTAAMVHGRPLPPIPMLRLLRRVGAHDDADEPAPVRRLRQAIAGSGLEGIVTYLGPRLDLADLIAACDVAVFPFRRDGAGRALLLALAQGTPVVATRVASVREQVAEAWACELVAPDDPEALAAGIERTLAQLDLRRADARRNPGLVRDWYAATVECGRMQGLYREVCLPEPWHVRWLSRLPRRRTAGVPRRWLATLWAMSE